MSDIDNDNCHKEITEPFLLCYASAADAQHSFGGIMLFFMFCCLSMPT